MNDQGKLIPIHYDLRPLATELTNWWHWKVYGRIIYNIQNSEPITRKRAF